MTRASCNWGAQKVYRVGVGGGGGGGGGKRPDPHFDTTLKIIRLEIEEKKELVY